MIIPIKTTKEKFANDLLVVLNPVLKLKSREKQLLSVLMLLHHTNSNIENGKLNKLLFSRQIRKRVRKSLSPSMSEASYNNHISQFKKKNIIKGGKISQSLMNMYKHDIKITYEFKLT